MNSSLRLLGGALSMVMFLGLGLKPAVAAKVKPAPISPAQRQLFYARAEQYFTNAILLKPRENGTSTNQAFQLAPLLLRVITATNSVAAPAVVFFDVGEVLLSGKPHPQVTYLWDEVESPARQKVVRERRGVRLILNARGVPVIWELPPDRSGTQVIFVAQSLEADAIKRHGTVLPGRRFAIEADLTTAPNSIVARVIEDNPAVMGPLVHLDAAGAVTTVICRCMAAQTRTVERTAYYELKALPRGWRGAAGNLDKHLRLPADF